MLEAMKALVKYSISQIHTAIPARIDKFDPLKMRAEVVPLAKWVMQKDGQPVDMPKIIEVPVSYFRAGAFIIRPPYKVGDIVLVVFSEAALDNLLATDRTADPQLKRRHAIDDAIVIGGLQTENKPDTPDDEKDALYIANTEKNARIFIRPSGDVVIKLPSSSIKAEYSSGNIILNTGPGKVYLGEDGAEHPVAFADVVKQVFDAHIHNGVHGPTSAPTSPMQNHDSKKVFTA